MKVDVVPFDGSLAASVAALAQRAFAEVSKDAQPVLSAALAENFLGPSNPAGISQLALAREGDDIVGSLAAVPARFRRSDGHVALGFQIGFFFVDIRAQGKGVGSSLLRALTDAFRNRDDAFLYTFPNARSIGRFDKLGYDRVASIPTYIYLPTPSDIPLRLFPARMLKKRGIEPVFVDAAEAKRCARALFATAPPQVGLMRDAAFFAWRYCGAEADQRYRFVRCTAKEDSSSLVLVLAQHRFSGIPFTILVDVLSSDLFAVYRAAISVARLMGGSPLIYANTNLGCLAPPRSHATPLGARVPRAANPRPVELMRFPADTVMPREDLAKSLFLTGDWMGF